jgi:hypothetical protein
LYQRALTANTPHSEQLLHLDQNLALAENAASQEDLLIAERLEAEVILNAPSASPLSHEEVRDEEYDKQTNKEGITHGECPVLRWVGRYGSVGLRSTVFRSTNRTAFRGKLIVRQDFLGR